MPDPILTSARDLLRRARDDMRAAIDGLRPDALNWRPAGDDTNSIAVLATHSLTSSREWLSVAVGEPPPERDRDSEFEASARDAGELLAFVDRMFEEGLSLVDKPRDGGWGARRGHA